MDEMETRLFKELNKICPHEFYGFRFGWESITLDGDFTPKQLRAIADVLEKYNGTETEET